MDSAATILPPTEPIVMKPRTAEAEPTTARALWPTFMRRTLTEEALDIAVATPRPTAR